jgi:hypothetical protein
MADDRKRRDDQSSETGQDMSEDRGRTGVGDEVRGIADEGEEEFEDTEDLDEDEDSDA